MATITSPRPGPADILYTHAGLAEDLQTKISQVREARLDRRSPRTAVEDLTAFLNGVVVPSLHEEEAALYGVGESHTGLLGSDETSANRRRIREHAAFIAAVSDLDRWRTPLEAQIRADRLLVTFESHIGREDARLIEAGSGEPVPVEIPAMLAERLEHLVRAEHDLLAAYVGAAAGLPSRDPKAHLEVRERLIAALCRHASVVTLTLYPAVRHALTPDEEGAAVELAADLHAAERAMLRMERIMHGDGLEPVTDFSQLWADVERITLRHFAPEEAMIRRVARALTPNQAIHLLAEVRAGERRAPTRPHPHAPHGGGLARIAARIDERLDRIRDALDSRAV